MATSDYVKLLYSDNDYSEFLSESCLLFVHDLISEKELAARFLAVEGQIKKQ